MFIHAIVLAIVIGFILKGRLSNLEQVEIKRFSLIIVAFVIEFIIVVSIQNSIIKQSIYTYIVNLVMYALIFTFTYVNKRNRFIFFMGIGFLLNAIPIFFNGGAMPVSEKAIMVTNIPMNIEVEGLYTFINENTRFWFLGDVIPFRGLRSSVVSIGDIIAALSMMLIIIKGMKKQSTKSV